MSRFGFLGSFALILSAFLMLVFTSAFLAPAIVQDLSSLDARLLARDWLATLKTQFDLPGEPVEFETNITDKIAASILHGDSERSTDVDLFHPVEFQSVDHFGQINGYVVFTKFGEVFIAGGMPRLRSFDDVDFDAAVRSSMRELKTVVFMHSPDDRNGKSSLVVIIPMTKFGVPRGVVSIEVDRHQIEGVMERGVQFTSFITATILAFLALVVMVTLFYWGRQRRKAEKEAIKLAFFDSLTGLPNRRRFHMDLPRLVQEASTKGSEIALLSIDVDKFKQINDLYGHGAGDAVLKEVGNRIKQQLWQDDLVYRLSGDEFVVILRDQFIRGRLDRICNNLVGAMVPPFMIEQNNIVANISIGAATYPFHALDSDQLLKRSDLALYNAKENGRGRWSVFTLELEQIQKHKFRLERDLRTAISGGELQLHFQPQVMAKTGQLVGFEALARWTHSELGPISPEEFINVAEQSGLIQPLGMWALETACTEAARWGGDLTIAVNLSPLQLRDAQIVTCVRDALNKSGLEPKRLELEITEGVLVFDTVKVRETLDELRQLGVGIAMDDFGTGYSSLSYLTRLPLTKLKIDRSFITNFKLGEADDAVVHCVIGLSKSLQLKVVAEGVETKEQVQALKTAGCDILQGYYFGKPTGKPSAVIAEFAAQNLAKTG